MAKRVRKTKKKTSQLKKATQHDFKSPSVIDRLSRMESNYQLLDEVLTELEQKFETQTIAPLEETPKKPR